MAGFKPGFNSLSFILILISFVFLLLATISSPIVSSFNLGKTSSHTYGIFGFCKISDNSCSKATYPYTLSGVDDKTDNWFLDSTTRDTLAKIFIIAPIALGFNFISLVVIIISHFQIKPAIIGGIVVNLLAFILTTLVAVIVIITFYPNLGWTGWILIGSAAATLISFIFMILTLLFHQEEDSELDVYDDSDVVENKFTNYSDKGLGGGFNSTFNAPITSNTLATATNNYSTNNTFESSSIEKDYEYKQKTASQTQAYDRSVNSNTSLYNNRPQIANDFTNKPVVQPYYSVVTGSDHGSKVTLDQQQQQQQQQAPYPKTNQYPTSVFEHHPEVEGHKPFTELDDEYYQDVEEELDESVPLNRNGTGSDADSDFTSVSQRAVNPQFYGHQVPAQNQYQQQYYPNAQQFQPHFQQTSPTSFPPQQGQYQQQPVYYNSYQPQAAPRAPQSTISDNVLSQNPDFAVGPAKRRVQPGFVPVASRSKPGNQMNASSLMGRGSTRSGSGSGSGPYGAAF
ncbi:SUR7/PalI family-domain-containing protein [Scheffersomyces amazonensis]|uniref:SUR7/PalI family-domain-containing protein n=1 Tax=Scheffersomyces amazonensis TaxID=1078765 RepID=UPI00315D6F6A